MIQEKSIVYIAFGELYVAMALLSIKTLKKLLENLIKNPKKLVIASNQMKKLSKDLEVKRKNKSAAEFFSDVLNDLIKTNHKKISKPC